MNEEAKARTNLVLGHRYDRIIDLICPLPKEVPRKILQCVVCEVETTPVIYGTCGTRGHVICRPCFAAYRQEMDKNEDLVVCPVMKGGKICGQKFRPWTFEKGIPLYWQHYLSSCEFRCSSAMYGCPFKGPGRETIEHESNECEFSHFRRCKNTDIEKGLCNAEFHSAIDCFNHYINDHAFPNGFNPLVKVYVTLKNAKKRIVYRHDDGYFYEDKGERILTQICSYTPGRYCFLVIEENENWLRIWTTEADSSIDGEEEVSINIAIPAPENGTQTSTYYQFIGKMLPFKTFSFKEGDAVGYFDVPKNFLKQFYQPQDKGKEQIGILFGIGNSSGGSLATVNVKDSDLEGNEPPQRSSGKEVADDGVISCTSSDPPRSPPDSPPQAKECEYSNEDLELEPPEPRIRPKFLLY